MLPLNKNSILSHLDSPVSIQVFDEIDSTNTFLKRNFIDFSSERPSLIVANSQSAGYGKFKRNFFSPNSGVYFSILLPHQLVKNPNLLTLAAGVAVCSVLKKFIPSGNFSLKWVNDILIDGLKCGGILAENISDDKGNSAFIIGIGVNINVKQFPDELIGIASNIPQSEEFDRNFFIAEVINSFLELLSENQQIIPQFRLLCSTFGHRVEVTNGNQIVVGQAVNVDDSGALIVIDDKKNHHLFNSGEVSKISI